MRIRIVLTAFFCLLACCALVAQNRTGQGTSNSKGGLMASPTSTKSSSAKAQGGRGIFDIATSSDAGKKSGSAASAAAHSRAFLLPPYPAPGRALHANPCL